MKVTIRKKFSFDCAHHLPFLPAGHKCTRVHGHTYKGFVEFQGTPDENGILIEYGRISAIIDGIVDHRDLNTLEGLPTSTTENIVVYLKKKFDELCERDIEVTWVRVKESKTTYAEIKK